MHKYTRVSSHIAVTKNNDAPAWLPRDKRRRWIFLVRRLQYRRYISFQNRKKVGGFSLSSNNKTLLQVHQSLSSQHRQH